MAEQEVHLGSFAPPFRRGGLTLDSSLRQAIPNQVILGNQASQKLGFSSLMLRIVSTGKGPGIITQVFCHSCRRLGFNSQCPHCAPHHPVQGTQCRLCASLRANTWAKLSYIQNKIKKPKKNLTAKNKTNKKPQPNLHVSSFPVV